MAERRIAVLYTLISYIYTLFSLLYTLYSVWTFFGHELDNVQSLYFSYHIKKAERRGRRSETLR
jgi:hypothetical protein